MVALLVSLQWLLWKFYVFKNPVRHTCLRIYLLLYLNFAFETPSIVNENCIKIFIFAL